MAEAEDQEMMDANELRALQAPLKKQYREQPETARTPARAEAVLDLDRVACRVRSWAGQTDAGLHPATGGDGSLACSADMLLEALVACAGVTMSAVATAMGVRLRGGRVIAKGHWDARGTLGVDREVPVGLSDIALTFELDTDADAATVRRLVEMSEVLRHLPDLAHSAETFGCAPDRSRGLMPISRCNQPTGLPGTVLIRDKIRPIRAEVGRSTEPRLLIKGHPSVDDCAAALKSVSPQHSRIRDRRLELDAAGLNSYWSR
jgi:uncharacterized OsmC-like protein